MRSQGSAERNRRLRVLILTPWYPDDANPYAGVFVRNHALAVSCCCDVVVLHLGTTDAPATRLWRFSEDSDPAFTAGLPCYRFFLRGSQAGFRPGPIGILGLVQALRYVRRRHGSWDVVHVHVFTIAWLGLAIARIWSTPLLITEHFSIIQRRQLNALQACLLRWCCHRAHAVLPVSDALKKAMRSYGVRARFRVVHNTVDTSLFRPPEMCTGGVGPIRILNVNSLVKNKGVALLLKALAQLPASCCWRMDILGDGPQRFDLEDLTAELGLQASVSFHGAVMPAQVAQWMRQADFFVLASESETFNLATAEALCTGLPVLVTRCGGPEEFVDESCGLLVQPGLERAMALGLMDMMSSLDGFDRQAIAGKARSLFGPQRIGSQIITAYLEGIRVHSGSVAGRC